MTRSAFKSGFCAALLATAASALLTAASAQDYDRDTSENVIVQAPYFHAERGTVFGVPGKLTLSRPVSYSDLDLTTPDGARELRLRVADTARDICDQLRDAYPVHQQPGEAKCYEGAYRAGLVRADAAIRDARWGGYYRARYSRY